MMCDSHVWVRVARFASFNPFGDGQRVKVFCHSEV